MNINESESKTAKLNPGSIPIPVSNSNSSCSRALHLAACHWPRPQQTPLVLPISNIESRIHVLYTEVAVQIGPSGFRCQIQYLRLTARMGCGQLSLPMLNYAPHKRPALSSVWFLFLQFLKYNSASLWICCYCPNLFGPCAGKLQLTIKAPSFNRGFLFCTSPHIRICIRVRIRFRIHHGWPLDCRCWKASPTSDVSVCFASSLRPQSRSRSASRLAIRGFDFGSVLPLLVPLF